MKFTLQYSGALSTNKRVEAIHALRRAWHPQLRNVWQRIPFFMKEERAARVVYDGELVAFLTPMPDGQHWRANMLIPSGGSFPPPIYDSKAEALRAALYWLGQRPENFGLDSNCFTNDELFSIPGIELLSYSQFLGSQFKQKHYNFTPFATYASKVTCKLSITLFRRDGQLVFIRYGGDLDNRIKSLIDSLRIPTTGQIRGDWTPDADERPFFCLLEDDAMISSFSVEAKELLTPLSPQTSPMDVFITIDVELIVQEVTEHNQVYLAQ